MIRKAGSKWTLHSKDGSKHLGTFPSLEAAKKREAQINYFKNVKSPQGSKKPKK